MHVNSQICIYSLVIFHVFLKYTANHVLNVWMFYQMFKLNVSYSKLILT